MPRIGHGYDVHKLVKDRDLIIGGVKIDYPFGLFGHSDADVLVHAIMDALLGASALGDIGLNFPDNDMQYKNADSLKLLEKVMKLIEEKNYYIENIDCTIVAQSPKLRPYISLMITNVANICKINKDQINIKATTEENLGFTGRKEGIAAHCVCIIETKTK